jgi:hypothetical protein
MLGVQSRAFDAKSECMSSIMRCFVPMYIRHHTIAHIGLFLLHVSVHGTLRRCHGHSKPCHCSWHPRHCHPLATANRATVLCAVSHSCLRATTLELRLANAISHEVSEHPATLYRDKQNVLQVVHFMCAAPWHSHERCVRQRGHRDAAVAAEWHITQCLWEYQKPRNFACQVAQRRARGASTRSECDVTWHVPALTRMGRVTALTLRHQE